MEDSPEHTSDTDEDSLERARDAERLHRRLQQQDGRSSDEEPPAERERHEAIDHAVEDVERSVRRAHGQRRT